MRKRRTSKRGSSDPRRARKEVLPRCLNGVRLLLLSRDRYTPKKHSCLRAWSDTAAHRAQKAWHSQIGLPTNVTALFHRSGPQRLRRLRRLRPSHRAASMQLSGASRDTPRAPRRARDTPVSVRVPPRDTTSCRGDRIRTSPELRASNGDRNPEPKPCSRGGANG